MSKTLKEKATETITMDDRNILTAITLARPVLLHSEDESSEPGMFIDLHCGHAWAIGV